MYPRVRQVLESETISKLTEGLHRENKPKGFLAFFWSFNRVKCSEILRIGRGCLIDFNQLQGWEMSVDAYRDSERPDTVLEGSTTGKSSVSIALMVFRFKSCNWCRATVGRSL